MSVLEVSRFDGVSFARSIRELAQEVRDLIRLPSGDAEFQDVLDRIDRLEEVARSRKSEELVRWLVSLRRLVEEQSLVPV